jgi:hypothetical protein
VQTQKKFTSPLLRVEWRGQTKRFFSSLIQNVIYSSFNQFPVLFFGHADPIRLTAFFSKHNCTHTNNRKVYLSEQYVMGQCGGWYYGTLCVTAALLVATCGVVITQMVDKSHPHLLRLDQTVRWVAIVTSAAATYLAVFPVEILGLKAWYSTRANSVAISGTMLVICGLGALTMLFVSVQRLSTSVHASRPKLMAALGVKGAISQVLVMANVLTQIEAIRVAANALLVLTFLEAACIVTIDLRVLEMGPIKRMWRGGQSQSLGLLTLVASIFGVVLVAASIATVNTGSLDDGWNTKSAARSWDTQVRTRSCSGWTNRSMTQSTFSSLGTALLAMLMVVAWRPTIYGISGRTVESTIESDLVDLPPPPPSVLQTSVYLDTIQSRL